MITRIKIEGFKSLEKVDLALGDLNLFIGTNASGKSNFFDALRVLQGIGYGFTFDEILNGKPKSATSEIWEGIRGGSSKALFSAPHTPQENRQKGVIRFAVEISPPGRQFPRVHYSIGFSPEAGCVMEESLAATGGAGPVYDSTPIDNNAGLPYFKVVYHHGKIGRRPHLEFEKSRPVLHQLLRRKETSKTHAGILQLCVSELSNTQRLDPSPTVLRQYSQAQTVRRMGEHGENFAALVKTILGDERAKSAYLSWLTQLTPTELDDVGILAGALGEPLFAIKEKGVEYPAPILSDGTLRFAAIAAAFFQPDLPSVLTIEEIENGIHPSRLRLLVELLKSQSSLSGQQIMATTHSPVILAWLKEEDFRTTFFCKRDEETGASVVIPLSKVPRFSEVVRNGSILDLFMEGWLESAL